MNLLSFPEMTRQQIDEYVQLGYSKLSGYLCSDNLDKHPCSDQLAPDTITTILSNRFELFPPPQLYEEPVKRHNWISKFYFGISKNKEGHFPEDGRIKYVAGREKIIFYSNAQPASL